jgi:hypothetical protein
VRKTREFIVGCLLEARAAGELREGVDAEGGAAVVMGAMQMAAVSRGLGAGGPAPSAVRGALLAMLRA